MHLKKSIIQWLLFSASLNSILGNLIKSVMIQESINLLASRLHANLRNQEVTIIARTGRAAFISNSLVQAISSGVPSLLVNEAANLNCDISYLLGSRKRREVLRLMLIEDVPNFEQALSTELILEARRTARMPRPRCAFVISSTNFNESYIKLMAQSFLKQAWNLDFINVVLMELSPGRINMHSYNPFSEVYTQGELAPDAVLFPEKTRNMYGRLLRVGLFDDVLHVSVEKAPNAVSPFEWLGGMDVQIAKCIGQQLNFQIVVEVIDSPNPVLSTLNASYMSVREAMSQGKLDFILNFFSIIGSQKLEEYPFESSDLTHPYSNKLLVRQSSIKRFGLSYDSCVKVGIMIVLVLVTRAVAMNFKFDLSTWTIGNIATIMLGGTINNQKLNRTLERIIFFLLVVVSTTYSAQVLESFANYFWLDTFRSFNSLQDVLDANIEPSIMNDTKNTKLYNQSVLQQIFLHSKTISSEEKKMDCLFDMLNESGKTDSCEIDAELGRLVASSFSNKKRDWTISLVDEPLIQLCWTGLAFAKTSPYVESFNPILRRLIDSGLHHFWLKQELDKFVRQRWHSLGWSQVKDPRTIDRTFVISLSTSFSLGVLVSAIAFFAELYFYYYPKLISRAKNRIENRTNNYPIIIKYLRPAPNPLEL